MKVFAILLVIPALAFADQPVHRRARVLEVIQQLATLDPITPEAAARRIGSRITARQTTRYRRDETFAPTAIFVDAGAAVGGVDDAWTAISLVPAADLDLRFEHVVALFPDAPYAFSPVVRHYQDGPRIVATDHRFSVAGGELVIQTDTKSVRVERIVLTTERSIPPNSPSLRAQRRGGQRGGR